MTKLVLIILIISSLFANCAFFISSFTTVYPLVVDYQPGEARCLPEVQELVAYRLEVYPLEVRLRVGCLLVADQLVEYQWLADYRRAGGLVVGGAFGFGGDRALPKAALF